MSRFFAPLFFFTLTVALYIWSARVLREYRWTPVRTPISFAVARSYTVSFRADKTTKHYVMIERDRAPDESFDTDLVRPAIVSCVVRNAAGQSLGKPGSGGGYGEKITSTLVTFSAARGQTYLVTIAVKPTDAGLDRLNPHLMVEITPVDFKKAYVKAATIQYGALFSAVLTVATLLYALSRRR